MEQVSKFTRWRQCIQSKCYLLVLARYILVRAVRLVRSHCQLICFVVSVFLRLNTYHTVYSAVHGFWPEEIFKR
jgi:hypothetical protein